MSTNVSTESTAVPAAVETLAISFTPPPVSENKQTDEEKVADHRAYMRAMLADSGINPDLEIPSPAKKNKKKQQQQQPSKEPTIAANTSALNSQILGDMVPSSKRKAKNTEEAGVTPLRSSSSRRDSETEIDEIPQPKMPSAKGRKVNRTSDDGALLNGSSGINATAPAVKTPTNRKRNASSTGGEPFAVKEGEDDASPSPTKKKRTLPPAKDALQTTKKSKGKKKLEEDVDIAASLTKPPLATSLTGRVKAKVNQVHQFINENSETDSVLCRDLHRPWLIYSLDLDILGVLLRMRADYECDEGSAVNTAGIDDIIVERFTAPTVLVNQRMPPARAETGTKWVVIDVDKESAFEAKIQQKIAGHGLHNINLLEIEAEMMRQQILKQTFRV